jgi:hypothetical protein
MDLAQMHDTKLSWRLASKGQSQEIFELLFFHLEKHSPWPLIQFSLRPTLPLAQMSNFAFFIQRYGGQTKSKTKQSKNNI